MIKTIVKLIEPKTLIASLVPVTYASAFSLWYTHSLHLQDVLLVLMIVMLMQSSANMINDLFDYSSGTDTSDRSDEKALVNGDVSDKFVIKLILIFEGIAFLLGLIIAYRYGWMMFLIGMISALISVLYTTGPKPISNTPFGELTSGLTMGLGITGIIIYLHIGYISATLILVSLPVCIFISLVHLTNNTCDIQPDRQSGRKTLPILCGYKKANTIWFIGLIFMYILFALFYFNNLMPLYSLIGLVVISPIIIESISGFMKLNKQSKTKSHAMMLTGKIGFISYMVIAIGYVLAMI